MELEEVKDCVVVGVPDAKHEGSSVPMAFVEVVQDLNMSNEDIVKLILEKCSFELPDYEMPEYVQIIKKIPYKNTKHDFKQLEALGEEYVMKGTFNNE